MVSAADGGRYGAQTGAYLQMEKLSLQGSDPGRLLEAKDNAVLRLRWRMLWLPTVLSGSLSLDDIPAHKGPKNGDM